MFSVVIPTFEGAQKIQVPIASLNAQTYRDFEVLFVDDCSPNFSEFEEVVARHARFPYRILQQEHHVNQVGGRALGIKEATMKYVCFLDHDDAWKPTKLEVVKHTIEAHPNPSQTIFYHQLECEYPDGRVFNYPSRGIRTSETVPEYLFLGNGMIQSSSMVFDRISSRSILMDISSPPHDDWDFSIEAEKQGFGFYYIDEVLATWNVRRMAGVSDRDRSDVSLRWYARKRASFSRSARVAFLVNVVFPKLVAEGRLVPAVHLFLAQGAKAPLLTLISGERLIARTGVKLFARSTT